jgi:hypothetical protein
MGYATSFTPQESDGGSLPSFTPQVENEGPYQVLLLKNQMRVCIKFYSSRIRWGYVWNFTPKESDEGLYQVLLLKNQMGVCTKFYS